MREYPKNIIHHQPCINSSCFSLSRLDLSQHRQPESRHRRRHAIAVNVNEIKTQALISTAYVSEWQTGPNMRLPCAEICLLFFGAHTLIPEKKTIKSESFSIRFFFSFGLQQAPKITKQRKKSEQFSNVLQLYNVSNVSILWMKQCLESVVIDQMCELAIAQTATHLIRYPAQIVKTL